MILFLILVNSKLDYFLRNESTIQDPFLNSSSSSTETGNLNETEKSNSSSTDKELNDDIGNYKLKKDKLISESDTNRVKQAAVEDFTKEFSDVYELGDSIKSITDKGMWEKLHSYIALNLHKFFVDGSFSIQLHIRYVACSYVIAFIPAEFAFVVPGFYKYLIPRQLKKVPLINEALLGTKRFFKFCKNTSKNQFLITFYFGRANTLLEDLDFIRRIPELIISDPGQIFREFFEFKIKAEGYDPNKY